MHYNKIVSLVHVTLKIPVWRKFSDSVTCARQGSSITFAYNADKQRNKMVYSEGGVPTETTYYVGNYEKIVAENGTFKEYDYIYTPDGLSAIAIETNGNNAPEYYYINTDYLGSIRAITDVEGNVYARYSYDAWGVQSEAPFSLGKITRRGYTGHEHLTEFGLINMNARMYDPVLGRFLEADPYVADGTYSQDFNRYSYARNNPFVYTDPHGEWVQLAIGAFIGGFMNLAMNDHKADNIWQKLGYFGVGAVAGALGAGVGAGIGSAVAGGSFGAGFMGTSAALTSTGAISGMAVGAGAGFSSGFTTGLGNGLIQGQNFGNALWSGTKTGLIAGATGGIIGGLAGGINAVTNNKDFWGGKPWQTIREYSLPDGNLPIHQQSNPEIGCTQETLESLSEYLEKPVTVSDMSKGEDFAQLASKYGFKTTTVMPNAVNSEYAVGAQLKIGNPSAITYNRNGIMHTVGINRIQMQQASRAFRSGFKTRTLIQVMDPLHSTYQNLSISLFRNGYIRIIVP